MLQRSLREFPFSVLRRIVKPVLMLGCLFVLPVLLSYGLFSETAWAMPPQKKVVDAPKSGNAVDLPARLHPNAALRELPRTWRNSIRRVQVEDGRKLIALTFDLCERHGERAGYDAGIVECLRKNHAKATFFAGGKWMRSHPDQTIRLMADPLFEIGTHGWAHENFRLLGRKEAEERLQWSQAQYELLREELEGRCRLGEVSASMESVPPLPRVFRFPFGACNASSLDMLAENGVAAIQWDVVSGDPAKGRTAKGIIETVLNGARAGSIVIFHANGREHGTCEALPGLIAALGSRGFDLVTVSELLQAGSPVASTDCYELKPGDNLRYDRFK